MEALERAFLALPEIEVLMADSFGLFYLNLAGTKAFNRQQQCHSPLSKLPGCQRHMIQISAFTDFETATTEVLGFLHSRLGFKLWMLTRVESDDWIVLNANDHGYDVKSGDVFRWTDSFCSRMVQGLGPRIAPISDEVPAYKDAPIGQLVDIGSYVGIPLSRSNGDLFGTLCAIDPSPVPQETTRELPLIEMMGRLLTTILESELEVQCERRRAERARSGSLIDQLTGLYNRRGWIELLVKETERCRRYGHPACLISIDLDDLKIVNEEHGHAKGDELLVAASEIIKSVSRESDVIARLGGDEFAMVAVECDLIAAEAILQRLKNSLFENGISASTGMSMWHASGTLSDALNRADQIMHDAKRRKKSEQSLSH